MVDQPQPMLAHIVYFTLKDNRPEAVDKLIDSCHRHLSDHAGTRFFAVGRLVDDLRRDVNVRDFDVALHVVFENRAAHDAYQEHPRHLQFIQENRDSWKQVRVYDTYVAVNSRQA